MLDRHIQSDLNRALLGRADSRSPSSCYNRLTLMNDRGCFARESRESGANMYMGPKLAMGKWMSVLLLQNGGKVYKSVDLLEVQSCVDYLQCMGHYSRN